MGYSAFIRPPTERIVLVKYASKFFIIYIIMYC